MGGRSRQALLTRSAALLLHGRMKVENVPIRITHVKGAMAPGLGRQLLDPLDLEAFEPRVFLLNIRDFILNQHTIIRCASQRTEPKRRTFGLAPQGEGASLQGKFDIVAAVDMGLDLEHRLIERTHLFKIRGHDGDECELHQTPLSPRGDGDMPGRTLFAWTACTPTILIWH